MVSLASARDSNHEWRLRRMEGRPAFLRVETALKEAGGLADTAPGRAAYAAYLEWQAAEGPAGKNEAYANLSQGWALGTEKFKADLVRDHQIADAARALEPNGAAEVRSMRWQEALEVAVDRLPATARTAPDAARKSAAWKVAVATHLKSTTDVSNGWLASQLDMGTAAYVSKHVGLLQRNGGPGKKWLEALLKVNGET
jgi:putative transposase